MQSLSRFVTQLISPPPRLPAHATKRTLFAAVAEGKTGPVRDILVRAPHLVAARDVEGRTALHLAVIGRLTGEFVEMLLKHGADPLARDNNGDTALHLAARFTPRDLDVITHLVDIGRLALLASVNHAHLDPIGDARGQGHDEIALMLTQRKAQFEAELPVAWSSLTNMTMAGTIDQLPRALADVGGINARRSGSDRTPLMLALKADRLPVVKWLVEHGADINAVSAMPNGDPGMPCICFARSAEVMTYMLGCGADLLARNADDVTGLDRIMVSLEGPLVDLAMAAAAEKRSGSYDLGPALCSALTLRKFNAAEHMLAWRKGALSPEDRDLALTLFTRDQAPRLWSMLEERGANSGARNGDSGADTAVSASATKGLLQEDKGNVRPRRCLPFGLTWRGGDQRGSRCCFMLV
jgi:ankyrin repeat protein